MFIKSSIKNNIDDNIEDFIELLHECIDDDDIYNKIHNNILNSAMSNDEKIDALEQLNGDKDDYDLMCLRNNIPFYFNNTCQHIYNFNDVYIKEEIGDKIRLKFGSTQNEYDKFYVDFMMTPLN